MGTTGPLHRAHRAIREGRVTATQLVSRALASLDASSATLNVVAAIDHEAALAEASRQDASPFLRPLAGLPILVKDLEDARGFPTRMGSRSRQHVPVATSDSHVPHRLRAAGAIVVGKSTIPEFAMEGYTASSLTGVTRNPWNTAYSPGGSSGGSAAALAAGLVIAATATDGGGSVRIPASFCGLLGLKPTNGHIGRWPRPDWIDLSTDGVLANSADDLRLLFELMAGPVAGDPGSFSVSRSDHSIRPRLVAMERTSPWGPLDGAVADCLQRAVAAASALFGATPIWLEPSSLFTHGDPDVDWFTLATAEHVNALGRAAVQDSMDIFDAPTRSFLITGSTVSIDDYLSARRRVFHYCRAVDELLGEDGLLLTPTVAAPGWMADGRYGDGANTDGLPPAVYATALQNVTGHPALSVPFGHLPSGIPFGLQITAPRGSDQWLLDIAAQWQLRYPWAERAPGYTGFDDLLGT